MATRKTNLQKLEEILNLLKIDKEEGIKDLDEALLHLKIHLKYLLFEKEALERERDYFMEQFFHLLLRGEN